ncbi:MAG: acyltransferase [Lachnospiraceae bacterium]|nr:acyltransferase [Lachnospiraceae bacterium]
MKKRIEFLDYMKAICVMLVITTHVDWPMKQTPIFDYFINMAVPIFMIISGYNFAMSSQRTIGTWEGGRKGVKTLYNINLMLKKLWRFIDPFLPICVVEIIILSIEGKNINLPRIFLEGAYGPGSYYVPLMIQLLVLFPILYVLAKKFPRAFLPLMAFATLLFEYYVVVSDMAKDDYRLLIGRYLFLIAFGCWFYMYPNIRLSYLTLVCMLVVGVAYLFLNRQGFDFYLFNYWGPTTFLTDFYIIPIVVILFRLFYHSTIPGWPGKLLVEIGKASYHIFLVQMVYYHFELGGPLFDLPLLAQVPINIIINVTCGIAFFEAQRGWNKFSKQKISSLKKETA